ETIQDTGAPCDCESAQESPAVHQADVRRICFIIYNCLCRHKDCCFQCIQRLWCSIWNRDTPRNGKTSCDGKTPGNGESPRNGKTTGHDAQVIQVGISKRLVPRNGEAAHECKN